MSSQLRVVPDRDSPRFSLRMSMAEIAELADVKRPVVTNWRRRYRSFPAPIGGNALELLFDSRQIADWLIATGRDPGGRIEADLSLYALTDLGTGLPANNLLAWVTALICLRNLDSEPLAGVAADSCEALATRAARLDPRDMCLRAEIGSLPASADRLAAAVDELVEAAWGCREAFERFMSARLRFRAGGIYARTVTPTLAQLIAELSGARERSRKRTVTICDPAGPRAARPETCCAWPQVPPGTAARAPAGTRQDTATAMPAPAPAARPASRPPGEGHAPELSCS